MVFFSVILLLHPEQGTTKGDNCGSFPAHPNQGYKSQMAHSLQEGMAAGTLYSEGTSVLPSQNLFLEFIWHLALVSSVTSVGPAGPVCPCCPKPALMNPENTGEVSFLTPTPPKPAAAVHP